jgi:hypothetical protein
MKLKTFLRVTLAILVICLFTQSYVYLSDSSCGSGGGFQVTGVVTYNPPFHQSVGPNQDQYFTLDLSGVPSGQGYENVSVSFNMSSTTWQSYGFFFQHCSTCPDIWGSTYFVGWTQDLPYRDYGVVIGVQGISLHGGPSSGCEVWIYQYRWTAWTHNIE